MAAAKGLPLDRWLTRSVASCSDLDCWRYREVQTQHRGKNKGQKIQTAKRPLRHLARFILIGQYTGTRAAAIAAASPDPAKVELCRSGSGIFYRLAQGKARDE